MSTTRSPGALTVLLAGMLLPVTLAACSSPSSSATTTTTRAQSGPTTTTRPANLSACQLISPSQVQATTGAAVTSPVGTATGTSTTCTYPASPRAQSVIIKYSGGVSTAQAAAQQATVQKHYGATTAISGLGDGSYTFSAGTSVTSLVTLVGSVEIVVTSTGSEAQLQALMQLILYALQSTANTTQPPA